MENKLTSTDKKYTKTIPGEKETSILNIIGNGVDYNDRVILDREQLKWIIGVFKKEGKVIGYTGGTYDLIHEGHLRYLEEIKKRCDILVVGVDSDELTRQRKPDIKNRPIVGLQERLLVLSHIRSVDILTVLDVGEHQDQLIIDILPDLAVFSKSTKDITEQNIRKNIQDYCGEVIFLAPQATTSTTSRIRLLAMDGADGLGKKIIDVIQNYLNPEEQKEG
jgi:cytidyltransferase-like protein